MLIYRYGTFVFNGLIAPMCFTPPAAVRLPNEPELEATGAVPAAGAQARGGYDVLPTEDDHLSNTPILPCLEHDKIVYRPSKSNRLQAPTFTVPPSLRQHLATAATHLRASRTVAFPTETVYGLGASSLDPEAVKKVYSIKGRPADNPLIMHVSSLNMLDRLLPPKDQYTLSPLYLKLISEFWPGPLTLLFPSSNPPPLPAPQTNAIRMPNHPLALALINHADLPISAPSANSSGRPSPTRAQHVYNDLNGAEGLGCILDGGECGVGVESTVVDGLAWKEGGGGYVDILRPGGLGVEEIARVVANVDAGEDVTEIRIHGRKWTRNAVASTSKVGPPSASPKSTAPSTPGLKYRHYSPRIPVFLLLPSNTFPQPAIHLENSSPSAILSRLATSITKPGRRPRLGFLHYSNSPLSAQIATTTDAEIIKLSLGPDSTSAARRLFSGMLKLEEVANKVDGILIEGCADDGLGLAVMERVGKAVGGGGLSGGLDVGEAVEGGSAGRFWVQV
jgi:L-threonylcarbamoyladenylate synthase